LRLGNELGHSIGGMCEQLGDRGVALVAAALL
jgi:hypothetical protein